MFINVRASVTEWVAAVASRLAGGNGRRGYASGRRCRRRGLLHRRIVLITVRIGVLRAVLRCDGVRRGRNRFAQRAIQQQQIVLVQRAERRLLEKQGQCVDPRSLNQLALLQVRHGDTVRLIADGAQADEALAAFKALAEQHFGETVSERQQPSLHGIPVAESVTSGPVFQAHSFWPPTVDRRIGADEVLGEQQRLREALQHTLSDLNRLAERTGTLIGKPQAAIFGAHSMLLDDPDLQQAAYTRIAQQLCCAEQAWRQVLEAIAEEYRELDDDYMRARELDVRDMLRRTLCHLQGLPLPAMALAEPSILVMDELMPSEVVMLDRRLVLGICLSGGNALSHSAILAKAMGIPMVVGMQDCLSKTRSGQKAMLDAARGVLQLSH